MQQYFPGKLLYGGDYNPEQWSEEVWREDMRLMKLAHVNIVSINIFSWALLEPAPDQYYFEQLDKIMDMLAQHGIMVALATATASPPTWMSHIYPSMLPVTREGVRMTHGSRQHYCPNSPDYHRKVAALVRLLVERYANHPALAMWHINNEYGCHTPACYCDNCAVAFRKWLQERYQTLEGLNDAWGTNFWSQRYYNWDDALPPRLSPAQDNPGQRLDYWRFMSDSLLACYRLEADILREVTPNVPVTTNLMVEFKPVDGFAWAPYMDLISVDIYPPIGTPAWMTACVHDVMRSLKSGRPHLVMEQAPSQVNWMPQNPQKRPGQMRLHVMQGIARGANGSMYFQWRQSQAGAEKFHSAVVSHEGSEHGRIFQQVARAGAELQKMAAEVSDTHVTARVAILLDWQNWWNVEYLPGPSNRLNYPDQVKQYYRALHELNVMVDFVEPDGDLSNYRLVIAPMLHLLRPRAAKNMEQFVERGGTLLTTFYSGVVDQHDHVILGGYPGELRKLLGIHVEEYDPWTSEMHNAVAVAEGPLRGTYSSTLWGELVHPEGADVLGVFDSDYYADSPALTVNRFGQGQAYYLATQAEHALLAKLMHHLCQEAQVAPTLTTPEGVEATKRVRADGKSIYFLLNHSAQVQWVMLPEGMFKSLLDERYIEGEIKLSPKDIVVLMEQ